MTDKEQKKKDDSEDGFEKNRLKAGSTKFESKMKENPISHGKDPNALAVAVLYAACLKEEEKISQAQIAVAGDISIVTLRKRFQDVRKIFPV